VGRAGITLGAMTHYDSPQQEGNRPSRSEPILPVAEGGLADSQTLAGVLSHGSSVFGSNGSGVAGYAGQEGSPGVGHQREGWVEPPSYEAWLHLGPKPHEEQRREGEGGPGGSLGGAPYPRNTDSITERRRDPYHGDAGARREGLLEEDQERSPSQGLAPGESSRRRG